MTAFRNRAGCAGLALLLAPILLTPRDAAAQIGPPIRLEPPGTTHTLKPPPSAEPATPPSGSLQAPAAPAQTPAQSPAQTPAQTPAAPDVPKAPSGMVIDALPAPNQDGFGVVTPQNGGFPDQLWAGTPRASVIALLPRIGSTLSPTLQSLAWRLLASTVQPPDGTSEPGLLLAMRSERLTNALGRTDSALALLQTIPPAQQSPASQQLTADLAFLANDIPAACATIRSRAGREQGLYWDQGMVTCQALDGATDQVEIGLDVLREAKFKDDGFIALVEKTAGTDVKLPDLLPAPAPMALALFAKIGQPLPKKVLDTARPAVLRVIATSAGLPPEQRLIAAEKAVAYGALPADKLAEAYLAVNFDDADRDSPLSRADQAGGARGRAILFNGAREAAAVLAKANYLAALLSHAPRDTLYPAVVRAAEPMILEVPASPDLKSVAADFARALYALDRPNEARNWLACADPADIAALLPLAHIAAGNAAPDWTGGTLAELLSGPHKDLALGTKRAILAAQLLAAEATPAGDPLILPLIDSKAAGSDTPIPGLLVDGAAETKRIGGTVLAVLAALGDTGVSAPGQTLAQAIRGLRAAGLETEARQLAIDVAIAQGF